MLAGTAFGAPFSHKTHLGLNLTCVTCHASAQKSARVEDNNLPSLQMCASCHKDKPPSIKAPRKTIVAKFSHQQHLKLGNIAPVIAKAIDTGAYLSRPAPDERRLLDQAKTACEACHRGLRESNAVTAAAFPQMADCIVCHNKVDPPFSCTQCHIEGPHLKPASHGTGWIDKHSTGKANLDKPSCAVCHGRKFTCLGCHSG